MQKISKRMLDALRPDQGGKDLFAWDSGDGALKGFGVRVKPSGAASYLIQYRTREGRTRRLTLGHVGVLSVDEARSEAREKLAAVAKGGDPSGERHRIRRAITVAELCDLYLSEARFRIKASTLTMDRSRIETHVKPLLGNQSVVSLTSGDIERMQLDIAAGKTAKPRSPKTRGGVARGGPVVASRTVGMLVTILEFARRRKVIGENPAQDVRKLPEGKQTRFLKVEEVAVLGEVLNHDERFGKAGIGHAAIRFILLTGLRRMEALALPWAWVDQSSHCLRFGDTKTGEQFRAIGGVAFSLLNRLKTSDGSRWVFPAENGDNHFVGLPKLLGRICFQARLQGVTIHVLRHSFAAMAADMGYSELIIAGLLGHSVAGVTARYAHVPDRALIAAADHVSQRIAAALDGHARDSAHSLMTSRQ